jgi:hypothetical protein
LVCTSAFTVHVLITQETRNKIATFSPIFKYSESAFFGTGPFRLYSDKDTNEGIRI